MSFFYAKVSCPKSADGVEGDAFFDLVNAYFTKEKTEVNLTNIPNNLDKAKAGDIVILHVGGDASNKRRYFSQKEKYKQFKNALLGVCEIVSVDSKNQEIQIVFYPFSEPVSKHDLVQFPIFIDNFGPLTKGSPNQAGLYEFSEEVFNSFIDYLYFKNYLGKSNSLLSAHHIPGFLNKELIKFYELNSDLKNDLISVSSHFLSSTKKAVRSLNSVSGAQEVSKPFLLLAGLSGTGKTRFVRKQAEMTGSLESTYCLVSVRPDWHEPSDLLGYVSRLGQNGAEFITTEVLNFIVKAWIEMVDLKGSFIDSKFEWKPKSFDDIRPFWLCLDEMNLAPVEQYFADYLSVIETRKWEGGVYSCEPLLKPDNFKQLERAGLDKLRKSLNLEDKKYQALWNYFVEKGVSIPFNLIVAGTVNMDETTHGFSRKVIDRALTFDFGAFFPNDFDQFFDSESEFKVLTYPQVSQAERADFSDIGHADLTIAFMKEVNGVLKGSLFELAYRALNECLIAVAVSQPNDDATLQAVWDDFLMMKVLPRIEGDIDKLQSQNPQATDKTLLDELEAVFEAQLNEIWADDRGRPDLFRVRAKDGSTINVKCRSKEKIKRMKTLLDSGFTSFWP